VNDEISPSVALPLIGTAVCTVLLGLALGYCVVVSDEIQVLTDDEMVDDPGQCEPAPHCEPGSFSEAERRDTSGVAFASGR
jgi:hypothetical protein